MLSCSVLSIILCLTVKGGKGIYLVPDYLINLQLIEDLHMNKSWTIYIDQLISTFPEANTLDMMYMDLSTTVALAKHWCGIPSSYIGVYQNTSRNISLVARLNVSNWAPCGVVILQYHMYPDVPHQTLYTIQVHQQFYINLSIVESEFRRLWTDWTQPTYISSSVELIEYLMGNNNCNYIRLLN